MRTNILNLMLMVALLVPLHALAQDGEMTEATADEPEAEEPEAEEEAAPAEPTLDIGDPNLEAPIPCTISMVDGTSHKGNLTHVLRARDWYGNDPDSNSGFTIAVDIHLLNLEWKDVKKVTVARPNTSSDMDCYSDEDEDPIMWECTLKQVASVSMRTSHQYSGQYRMDTREKFVFVFDNDASTAVEFTLYKYVANTQHYDSMSQALSDLQGILKKQNSHGVKSIVFE
jgi:hypothetical protein